MGARAGAVIRLDPRLMALLLPPSPPPQQGRLPAPLTSTTPSASPSRLTAVRTCAGHAFVEGSAAGRQGGGVAEGQGFSGKRAVKRQNTNNRAVPCFTARTRSRSQSMARMMARSAGGRNGWKGGNVGARAVQANSTRAGLQCRQAAACRQGRRLPAQQSGAPAGPLVMYCPPAAYCSSCTACNTTSMVTRPAEGMAGAPTAARLAVAATTSSSAGDRATP